MDTTTQNTALSGIASAFQPSNAAQTQALSQVNAAFAPTPSYTPPSATSVSSLTSPQTPANTGTPPASGISLQDIQNLIGTPSTAETQAQTAESVTQNTLQDLMTKLGTQGSEQTNLESQAGLPQMNQTLNDLTSQMNTVNAQLGQTKLDAMGRLVPMFQQSAEEQAAQRQASAQLLGLSASANAIKGNIATANTQVANALKAEFDPVNAQIKYWQDVLTQNRADMTAAQKAKADTITQTLNQYNLQVKQQQAEKSAVYTVMLDAAKNGADAATLAKIQAAPDQASAIAAAGSSLTTTKNQIIGGETGGYTNVTTDAKGNVISSTPVKAGIGGVSSTYSFTPTVKTQLAGAGNTAATISQLEKDIAAHGAQYVLDNGKMDAKTQSILETEFGITKTQPTGQKSGLFGWGFLGL